MRKELLVRGPPEVIFSFTNAKEIVLNLETSIINGREIILFQPCKV